MSGRSGVSPDTARTRRMARFFNQARNIRPKVPSFKFRWHRFNTVNGLHRFAQFGVTLMHEHVFVLDAEILQNYPEEWGDEDHASPTPSRA